VSFFHTRYVAVFDASFQLFLQLSMG